VKLNKQAASERAYARKEFDLARKEQDMPLTYIRKVFDSLSPELQERFFYQLCHRYKHNPKTTVA